MPDETESRFCPYCGIELKHPYWRHLQKEHSERYAQKETWVQLYKDYKAAGMDQIISIQVISELFNATQDEIKSFLKNAKVL
ncbi:MAG: hypothetical protein MUP85_05120 [Candidatus Lokiarchaeota archaeon]|nr:hypothetical protein [Candidatus Lokiarchaeota archaeon]